jgi:hypothetical protein
MDLKEALIEVKEEKRKTCMTKGSLIFLTLIVALFPVIIMQILVILANKELNKVRDEPFSNKMLPEEDYGKGQKEAENLDKAKTNRNNVIFLCSVVASIIIISILID